MQHFGMTIVIACVADIVHSAFSRIAKCMQYLYHARQKHYRQMKKIRHLFSDYRYRSADMGINYFRLQISENPETRISGLSKIRVSGFSKIRISGDPTIRIVENPKIRVFRFPKIRIFGFPKTRIFGIPKIRIFGFPKPSFGDFRKSGFPKIRKSGFPDYRYRIHVTGNYF